MRFGNRFCPKLLAFRIATMYFAVVGTDDLWLSYAHSLLFRRQHRKATFLYPRSSFCSTYYMPSTNYTLIRDVIENTTEKKAILAYYAGTTPDPQGSIRKLWPHVLGVSKTGNTVEEVVLCYQYDGYSKRPVATPHPKLKKNMRCFKVASLRDPTNPIAGSQVIVIDFASVDPPPPAGQSWEPKKLTYKQLDKQNCVEDVDVFR
jgi:hypothetical protein